MIWFGYDLDSPTPVRVELGEQNALSPNGTPPTLFGPGLHVRVVSVETTDGNASWSLAGSVVASGAQTPLCGDGGELVPATTDPTEPGATDPVTTDAPETTVPGTEVTDTTEPCVGDECDAVTPVVLSLIANSIECTGFGVAVFSALNENEFTLDGDGFSSELVPARLDGAQPVLISSERIETVDGPMVSEIFAVRYVTAVSWTVTHDGLASTVSAGQAAATDDPNCPTARVDATGIDGSLTDPGTVAPTSIPVAGRSTAPYLLMGIMSMAVGLVLVGLARRKIIHDAAT